MKGWGMGLELGARAGAEARAGAGAGTVAGRQAGWTVCWTPVLGPLHLSSAAPQLCSAPRVIVLTVRLRSREVQYYVWVSRNLGHQRERDLLSTV